MRACRFAPDAGNDLFGACNFQIEKPHGLRFVDALDQMEDVGFGVLRIHDAGYRKFHLAPVDDDGGVHREVIVLAGMVNVQVRVHDVADVPRLQPMVCQLVFDHVSMVLEPSHSEGFHDGVVAIPGIDQDRIFAARYQESTDRHATHPTAIVAQHEKRGLKLDVAVVENVDLKCHLLVSLLTRGRCPHVLDSIHARRRAVEN